jgi:DNA-3-methyladenine glycosylase
MEPGDLETPGRAFFAREAVTVAQELLGTYLISSLGGVTVGGRIVETEAYTADDPASHSYPGPTARNGSMYREGGTLYVYLIYGVHYCLNVVTGPAGTGEAVLLRAFEPVWGVKAMARRRRGEGAPEDLSNEPRTLRGIADGPGKIAQALGVSAGEDGSSLLEGPVQIMLPSEPLAPERILATHRIGITKAARMHRRFVDAGSSLLSKKVYTGR